MSSITDLPTPDFSYDPDAPGACVAGVRPYRNISYRLEAETIADKFIVHNYGHGGAGITLSWGCAGKVREIVQQQPLVQQHLSASHGTAAAVLGAGVMGMTAATLLCDLGLAVTIYAERMPVDTTSFKAGGQWAVSVVEFQGKEQELSDIIKTAYTRFESSIGQGFGVSKRPNYTPTRSDNLEIVLRLVPGLIPEPCWLSRLPFAGITKPGWKYETLLIEPPIFLPRLEADLRARGVAFVQQKFASKSEILTSLSQNIIINCTGLGAMTLWSDPKMVPIKGQLAMLPAQFNLQYLFGQDGYLFPRTDHVVIGGTFEVGVNDETADKAVCQGLVDHMKSVFGLAPAEPLPEIHIHHPDHAPIVNPAMPVA